MLIDLSHNVVEQWSLALLLVIRLATFQSIWINELAVRTRRMADRASRCDQGELDRGDEHGPRRRHGI